MVHTDCVIRRRVTVSGQVQGVGFRYYTAEQARDLGVHGTVRNLANGNVEAEIEGLPAAIDAMVAWLHAGPRSAVVDNVTVVDVPATGEKTFRVAH
ncbi:acylphosphatase [Cryobacterium psychrophilum]|nr:acylphosphatase [Cryobacterium psychrophilum]